MTPSRDGSIQPLQLPGDSMSLAFSAFNALASILQALDKNPLGAVVLVVLAAFALIGYVIYKST